MYGAQGNDLLCGGDGNDILSGGLGNDKLDGSPGFAPLTVDLVAASGGFLTQPIGIVPVFAARA
ncbi:MAG: hypothetical protein ACRESZ_05405 [Methylococcales bacterium]